MEGSLIRFLKDPSTEAHMEEDSCIKVESGYSSKDASSLKLPESKRGATLSAWWGISKTSQQRLSNK